jgi:hypothetical protein
MSHLLHANLPESPEENVNEGQEECHSGSKEQMRLGLHGVKLGCGSYSKTLPKPAAGARGESADINSYSHTILLPKTSFPLRTVGAGQEELYRKKTTEELYKWQVRVVFQRIT